MCGCVPEKGCEGDWTNDSIYLVMESKILMFHSLDRMDWLCTISNAFQNYSTTSTQIRIVLRFAPELQPYRIHPVHVASLACLVESFASRGFSVNVDRNSLLGEYFFTELNFREYWAGGKNFVEAKEDSIFNLWRLKDCEKEIVPIRVCEYFKRGLFKRKDLATVQLSLDEAFYNVFDHAEANGNAFLFLRFNEERGVLSIAVCDFGRGIPSTVKAYLPGIDSDVDALKLAIQDSFTVKSQGHNKGFGLGNIRDAGVEGDSMWIVSNEASLVTLKGSVRGMHNEFFFPGTAIFYDLTLKSFEDEEIIDNFEITI